MGITKELREYAAMFDNVWLNPTNDTITFTTSGIPPAFDSVRMNNRILAIADRIDAEHQKAIRELNNLADASVLLPVDADGEYIRVGDRVEHTNGTFTVNDMTFSIDGQWRAWDGENGHTVLLTKCLHHHAPTVEDLLREFGDWYAHTKGGCDEDGIIAEYAAKLRLADGDAE